MNMKKSVAILGSICFLFLLINSSSAADVKPEERREVSHYVIKWTFDKPVITGPFITGD